MIGEAARCDVGSIGKLNSESYHPTLPSRPKSSSRELLHAPLDHTPGNSSVYSL